jgi:hypothetical protein
MYETASEMSINYENIIEPLSPIHKRSLTHEPELLLHSEIYMRVHQPEPLDIFHHPTKLPNTSPSLCYTIHL